MIANYHFDTELARHLITALKKSGIEVYEGLSSVQFENIESALKCPLPEDLKTLLSIGVPVDDSRGSIARFPQWHQSPNEEIRISQEIIESGFIFDIENAGYWHPLFGGKPDNIEDAKQQAIEVLRRQPPLVRLYGHRFMPTAPSVGGNPVYSFMQPTDTVYYAVDIIDFFHKEFKLTTGLRTVDHKPKKVDFWDDVFMLSD